MGTLLISCVEVHELIELSLGVVSVVGPGIGVLDGVDVLQGEGGEGGVWEVSQSFSHWFQWHIVKQKCIKLVCEKLTIFLYDRISLD